MLLSYCIRDKSPNEWEGFTTILCFATQVLFDDTSVLVAAAVVEPEEVSWAQKGPGHSLHKARLSR